MTQPDNSPVSHPSDSGDWSAPVVRDLTGKTLGDFQVERLLGHGGMGEVYLTRQISLDRPAALKVLKPDLLANPNSLARFESEAWAAARLNHPNIVHIYTLGTIDAIRFIAMEYVPGTNLREYLQKKGVPELPLALSIMRQAGQAVGAAGEVGLIHRDIKPENLLLTKKGQVKVADFGLCRGPDSDRMNLTQQGVTLGTPMYMSPEQVQGRPIDHRSDLYSMGVTFYHMLAGFPPFRADNSLALALKHVQEEPISLAVHRPDLPSGLIDLVMKLIAKRAEDRYQTAAEMLRDLSKVKEQVLASMSQQAAGDSAVRSGTAASTSGASTTQLATAQKVPTQAQSSRAVGGFRIGKGTVALLSMASLVGGAVWGWVHRVENLLGPDAPAASARPGLWMAPWRSIPAQKSPEAQYRHAQVRTTDADLDAAWLAVPGRYPNSLEWSYRAYVQLARHLARQHDSAHLGVFAEELAAEANHRPESDREKWTALSRVVRAAARAVEGDAGGVVDQFQSYNIAYLDPALAELGLEIEALARQSTSGRGPEASRLNKLRTDLLKPLQIDPAAMNPNLLNLN